MYTSRLDSYISNYELNHFKDKYYKSKFNYINYMDSNNNRYSNSERNYNNNERRNSESFKERMYSNIDYKENDNLRKSHSKDYNLSTYKNKISMPTESMYNPSDSFHSTSNVPYTHNNNSKHQFNHRPISSSSTCITPYNRKHINVNYYSTFKASPLSKIESYVRKKNADRIRSYSEQLINDIDTNDELDSSYIDLDAKNNYTYLSNLQSPKTKYPSNDIVNINEESDLFDANESFDLPISLLSSKVSKIPKMKEFLGIPISPVNDNFNVSNVFHSIDKKLKLRKFSKGMNELKNDEFDIDLELEDFENNQIGEFTKFSTLKNLNDTKENRNLDNLKSFSISDMNNEDLNIYSIDTNLKISRPFPILHSKYSDLLANNNNDDISDTSLGTDISSLSININDPQNFNELKGNIELMSDSLWLNDDLNLSN